MIKLSIRLMAIADLIEDNTNLIDIGCDHALLDIYLAQKYQNINLTASDTNKNALENAKKNIKKYKLEKRIKTIQSNGLENIEDKTLDTIVISGMGAHTIVGILYKSLSKLKNINTLIIQSNNDLDFLRNKITKIGYFIKEETLVEDSNIIYTIIVFQKGTCLYTKKDLYFGPILLKKREPLWIKKLKIDLEKLEKFYPNIPKNRFHHRWITYRKIKELKKILR